MSEKVLVLRTCDASRKAYGGFQYPESGPVEAPDWDPRPVCGGGLHGLRWGEGDAERLSVAGRDVAGCRGRRRDGRRPQT